MIKFIFDIIIKKVSHIIVFFHIVTVIRFCYNCFPPLILLLCITLSNLQESLLKEGENGYEKFIKNTPYYFSYISSFVFIHLELK